MYRDHFGKRGLNGRFAFGSFLLLPLCLRAVPCFKRVGLPDRSVSSVQQLQRREVLITFPSHQLQVTSHRLYGVLV